MLIPTTIFRETYLCAPIYNEHLFAKEIGSHHYKPPERHLFFSNCKQKPITASKA